MPRGLNRNDNSVFRAAIEIIYARFQTISSSLDDNFPPCRPQLPSLLPYPSPSCCPVDDLAIHLVFSVAPFINETAITIIGLLLLLGKRRLDPATLTRAAITSYRSHPCRRHHRGKGCDVFGGTIQQERRSGMSAQGLHEDIIAMRQNVGKRSVSRPAFFFRSGLRQHE